MYWYPLELFLSAPIDQGDRTEAKPSLVFPTAMVVKVKDAETKRSKASVAHTGWNKRKKTSTTTPKKACLYSSSLHLALFVNFEQKICKSQRAGDRAAGKTDTRCDWASCVKERGLMRSSPTVLQSSLSRSYHVPFSFSFPSSPAYCRFFCSWSQLLSASLSAFTFLQLQKQLQATQIQTGFFGVVVCATLALFPRCFSVFHLDNHGSWEHQRRNCLCSIPLVDLSA